MNYYDPHHDTKIEINITADDRWTVLINEKEIYFSRFVIDLDATSSGPAAMRIEVDPRLWGADEESIGTGHSPTVDKSKK